MLFRSDYSGWIIRFLRRKVKQRPLKTNNRAINSLLNVINSEPVNTCAGWNLPLDGKLKTKANQCQCGQKSNRVHNLKKSYPQITRILFPLRLERGESDATLSNRIGEGLGVRQVRCRMVAVRKHRSGLPQSCAIFGYNSM